MKITIIGTGYVGLVAGICFADFGNDVVCLDTDSAKVEGLNQGICPIYEPGAQTLLERNRARRRLRFTDDVAQAIRRAELICIAVGTPENDRGGADLSGVFTVANNIAQYIENYVVVVDKSTVPIGTAKKVEEIIQRGLEQRGCQILFDVVSNPEFLREGKAVSDFMNPDRIVIGARTDKAFSVMRQLYNGFERSHKPMVLTTPETAELIKYASNAFLATKITFINEIANLCEKIGADVQVVAHAMGQDGRIGGKFLHPGPGYGGSCFPKDTKALVAMGQEYGVPLSIIDAVVLANERQKVMASQKIICAMPAGGTLALLGLAFKPDTDDVRESPALSVIKALLAQGNFRLRVYDPQAMDNAKRALGQADCAKIIWCENTQEALDGASALVILTEWMEFRSLDFGVWPHIKLLFDLRNIYHREDVLREGIQYYGTGK